MKKGISILLSIAMLVQFCSVLVYAADTDDPIDSGTCGENLTWELSEDFVLTISGEGEMPDYTYDEMNWAATTPWAQYATEVKRVVVEDGVTTIGSYAFYDFWSLYLAEIGSDVMLIQDYAFSNIGMEEDCTIRFYGNAPAVGSSAFYECYVNGLYPSSALGWEIVTSDNYDDAIDWIAIDESGVIASGNCGADIGGELDDNLTWEMNIDGTLTISGSGAMSAFSDNGWEGFKSLINKVVLPEGITSINPEAFRKCKSLREIEIPDSVTKIGDGAFGYCSSLSRVVLGDSLTKIGSGAFLLTDITEITIPENVEEIGSAAFAGCHELKTVTFTGNAPVFIYEKYNEIFSYVTATCYYPADDATWTEDVRQNYGGTLTWVAVETEDTAAPEISLVSPGNGSYVRGETTFTVTASDDRGLSKIKMQRSGADEDICTVSGSTAEETFTVDVSGMEEGSTLTLYFIAVDTSDHPTEIVCEFIVDNIDEPTDITPPVISDVWPSSEDQVTFCHDGTVQIAAADDTALGRAEIWAAADGEDPVMVGEGFANQKGIYTIKCDLADLAGSAVLTYKVYDTVDNCTEETAEITIRSYEIPETPVNLTAEAGFRSAELTWEYTGDLATLKQFNLYDANGEMLIASVKRYSYTIREMIEESTYWVDAEDIYGVRSFYTEVTVTPILTEDEAPVAGMQNASLTGVTGTPVMFSGASSTDNDRIESYTWDFGDGSTGEGVYAEHTYPDAGTYTVTLTVADRSGNTDSTTASVTIYDTLGADATHAVLTVTVMDGYEENTPAVADATVTVYNSIDFEIAAKTDAQGRAVLVVPKGAHTMTVVKSGYGGKVQQIEVITDEEGQMALNVYLAKTGVSVVDGQLTATPMTYEEILEAGIDVSDPANNHVVRQALEIRFRPAAELEFELDLDVMINAGGKQVGGTGFGWHKFIPDPDPIPDPSRPRPPKEDDTDEWIDPEYTVGVFPIGENAYMVIYGQTHWLKEMFNVELLIFNTSYGEDITECYAELTLPEGLSLADMLEGQQHEKVMVGNGTIEYIDKEIDGVKVGSNIRQVNWYVRGDQEGTYNLTASVTGEVGGSRFESTFVAEEAIEVFAGSALELTVTLPESAYHEKEYVVRYDLTNVSNKPIYNLSFGIDAVRQFTVERLSTGDEGGIRDILDETAFANNKTFLLPELDPGESFSIEFKTKFLYEQEFAEFVMGKIPGAEVGYKVAEAFVTTMDGSTTEIPVKIVLEDIRKMSFSQWVWDEALKELVETAVDTVVDYVDAVLFGGVPVVKNGVKIVKLGVDIKDELDGTEQIYEAAVCVNGGVQCVTEEEAMEISNASSYGLRRSTAPGVLVWTDIEDHEIDESGKNMTLRGEGNLYILRVGETEEEPLIDVTTKYIDTHGEVQEFTRTLTAAEDTDENGDPVGGNYIHELQAAKDLCMEDLAETAFEVPAENEIIEVVFKGYMIAENGELLLRASNENWTITDEEGMEAEGMYLSNGVLVIDSDAGAGTYTVKLTLDGTDAVMEQSIVLNGDSGSEEHSLIKTEKLPADCTTDGVEAYWTCSECGRHYSDADGTAEIADLDAWKSGEGRIAAGHTYGERIAEQAAVHTPTERKGAVAAHYYCDACDTYFTESKEPTTLQALTGDVPEHTDGDSDHACDICGAENITEHSFLKVWSYNKDAHWHDSACGHDVIIGKAAHEYGSDRMCDVCGYIRPYNGSVPVLPVIRPQKNDSDNIKNDPDKDVIEGTPAETPWQNPFRDVNESDWFYEDVKYMSENGLMLGTNKEETLFSPEETLTRAMLVTVLWRLEGQPAVNGSMPFADVEPGQWYTEAILWAASAGIINGYGNGDFGTMDAVTREQIMAILHRYADYRELDSGVVFPMIPQYGYSLWAENDILWADMNGLTDGIGTDIFDMTAEASRAEIAAYLRRFCMGTVAE